MNRTKEMKKTIPFSIILKNNKRLRNKITKEVKDLYNKKYITLKRIQDD
jgi:hypothetical protein